LTDPIPIYQAIILGIVQGITEPLPISSTGHLRLFPRFFGWDDAGLAFDIALHAGTLIAIVAYFWRDWTEIIRAASAKLRGQQIEDNPYIKPNLLWGLIIGCIPAGIIGLLLNDSIDSIEQNPALNNQVMIVVASMLIIVGGVIFASDRYGAKKRHIGHMNIADWLVIGFAQAIALIPGVSRSGATMSAGLIRGLERDAAARFSFLLSAPIVFAATMKHVVELMHEGMPQNQILPFIVGTVTSAVVGYAAIKFLLGYVRKHNFNIFVWYRLALGVFILILVAVRAS